MAIFLTILTAVAVFVIGQILQRMFIEPILEQRKIVARIAHATTLYENAWLFSGGPNVATGAFDNDRPEATLAIDAIRLLASDLRASETPIPLYALLERIGLVVPRRDIGFVSHLLLAWQANLKQEMSKRARKAIQKRLKIDFGEAASATEVEQWMKDNNDAVQCEDFT